MIFGDPTGFSRPVQATPNFVPRLLKMTMGVTRSFPGAEAIFAPAVPGNIKMPQAADPSAAVSSGGVPPGATGGMPELKKIRAGFSPTLRRAMRRMRSARR